MHSWHDGLKTPSAIAPPLPDRPRIRTRHEDVATIHSTSSDPSQFEQSSEARVQVTA